MEANEAARRQLETSVLPSLCVMLSLIVGILVRKKLQTDSLLQVFFCLIPPKIDEKKASCKKDTFIYDLPAVKEI